MSEQPEDLNTFNSWDNFGATLMLGLVPVVLYYVFTKDTGIITPENTAAAAEVIEKEPDKMLMALMVLGAVLVSLAVLGLSLLTRWRIISKLVNLAGCILTPLYLIVTICHWLPDSEQPAPQPEATQPAAPAQPNQEG